MAPLLAQQRQKWAERCHAHGLSLMGAHALALLEMHGPMPMSRLADELGVALRTPPASSNRLAERGIVDRDHADADRRVVLVSLTDAGRSSSARWRRHGAGGSAGWSSSSTASSSSRLLQAVRDLREAAAIAGGQTRMSRPAPPVDDAPVHVDHRARMEILGAILLTIFLSALDQTVVGTALPANRD